MELGRVDSEDKYLSQPPNTFIVMVDVDNMLYEIGEEPTAYNAAYEVYKLVGDTLANIKGFTDEKRQGKLDRFLEMIEKYRRDHSDDPRIKNGAEDVMVVNPAKKGVPAPKKS
jgi:hypothetical protein